MSPEQVAMVRELMAKYQWDEDEAIFAVALAMGESSDEVVVVDPSGDEYPVPFGEPVSVGARSDGKPIDA
jgi:hypothetical protein